MKTPFEIICSLVSSPSVTGTEKILTGEIFRTVLKQFDDSYCDELGNVIVKFSGNGKKKKKILVEAHRDVIGLCVKSILDGGFFSVAPCGGFSFETLPGNLWLLKKRDGSFIHAVSASIPPHLLKNGSSQKQSLQDLYFNSPYFTKKELESNISIGDTLYFGTKPVRLQNNQIASPYLDNFAAVTALILTMNEICVPNHDLYFLFSVGEESTSSGVRYAARRVKPDLGLVLDAGFGRTEGLNHYNCIDIGKGPSVSMTDTLSREAENWVYAVAGDRQVSIQRIAEPGGTGTSGTAMSLMNGGVPTALISIPVKNMHTQSEIVSENDILETVKLLTYLLHENKIPFFGEERCEK